MPDGELVGPEIGRFGVMPVWENGVAGPDGTDVAAAIGILEEEVVCRASVVGFVSVDGQSPGLTQSKVLTHLKFVGVRNIKSRVNERNKATSALM